MIDIADITVNIFIIAVSSFVLGILIYMFTLNGKASIIICIITFSVLTIGYVMNIEKTESMISSWKEACISNGYDNYDKVEKIGEIDYVKCIKIIDGQKHEGYVRWEK